MTAKELREVLEDYPDDAVVTIDGDSHDVAIDGDRFVRAIAGVRHQQGYNAIALDVGGAPELDEI